MVSIGTATDTGGSVRIPATYCGLVGLKPTTGSIPSDPASRAMDWIDLTTAGPLGAAVDDVRIQLRVLADPFPLRRDPRPRPEPRRPSRLLVLERWVPRGPLPHEDVALFEEAVADLSRAIGLEPERREAAQLFPDVDVGIDWALIAAPELLGMLGGSERLEAVKDRLHPNTAAFAELGASLGIDAYLAARHREPDDVRRRAARRGP
jgi:Asp-tRNA(Asn)/Glu-tRNA(Gln) amidotransferase A subunit family amidase